MQVAKHYLFHDGGFSRANQSIDLFCIELFLDVVKQNLLLLLLLLFFFVIFLSGFSFTNIHDSQNSR